MERIINAEERFQGRAIGLAVLLTLLLILISWADNSAIALALAVPFSLTTYVIYFSVGEPGFAHRMDRWSEATPGRYVVFPALLVALLFLYVWLGGERPLQGNGWHIPLLFMAPVLYGMKAVGRGAVPGWRDVPFVILCLLPYGLSDYPFNSELPYGGGGVEPLYLTLALILLVYSVGVIRRLDGIGFVFNVRREELQLTLRYWTLFFLFVLAVGLPGGLFQWVGYKPFDWAVLLSAAGVFVRTLFGVGLPEELVFRGILQNMLARNLAAKGRWRLYWLLGTVPMLPLALYHGYVSPDRAWWFPLSCAALILVSAYVLSARRPERAHTFTALALVAVAFGLAHFRIESNIYLGLAMLAGLCYGYIYVRTESVVCSALAHTLVNTMPAMLGLSIIR